MKTSPLDFVRVTLLKHNKFLKTKSLTKLVNLDSEERILAHKKLNEDLMLKEDILKSLNIMGAFTDDNGHSKNYDRIKNKLWFYHGIYVNEAL